MGNNYPEPKRRRSVGSAGKGLQSGRAGEKFGKAAKVGSLGERRFAMYCEAMLPLWMTSDEHFWTSRSAAPRIPNERTKRYEADVDFAFASGNRVVFVDAKMYAGQRFYWNLFPMGDYTVREGMGTPYRGSKGTSNPVKWGLTMDMANDMWPRLFQKLGVNARLEVMTIFVPSGKIGSYRTEPEARQLPSSVYLLRAPGGHKSYKLLPGMRKISRILGPQEPVRPGIRTALDANAH